MSGTGCNGGNRDASGDLQRDIGVAHTMQVNIRQIGITNKFMEPICYRTGMNRSAVPLDKNSS